jgi:hypothetical protein
MNDDVLVEIYRQLVRVYRCSAEDILEDPNLRTEYLTQTRQRLGALPEHALLHRLSYLRKQRRLPRSRDISAN